MILAILQARSSSRRLPQKVLKPILGVPMLARQIERLNHSKKIDRLVVATSIEPEDKLVEEVATSAGVSCFRGSLDDVLDRFYQAAKPHAPDYVVRLTGDCPLADWEVIDDLISFTIKGGYDYACNTNPPTYPDGLDAEVMTFAALTKNWHEAGLPHQREHVTPYLYAAESPFKKGNLANEQDLSGLRWTVDEPRDFEFATKIYESLYPANPKFLTKDILAFLKKNPEILAINADIERNEGYKLSLEKLGLKP